MLLMECGYVSAESIAALVSGLMNSHADGPEDPHLLTAADVGHGLVLLYTSLPNKWHAEAYIEP